VGFVSGTSVSGGGNAEASMGIDAADFDNDGDDDLIVTNWLDQMNVLYVNDGRGNFDDRRAASGLGVPSLARTGFGVGWIDVDNDGWLDLFVANGGVARIEAQARTGDLFPLKMPNQLYLNLRNGRFEDASARAGAVFMQTGVGRGVAFGDIDNDGDVDAVIGHSAGRLQLLINNIGDRNHWLGLRLIGSVSTKSGASARDMPGTRVEIVRPGMTPLRRRSRADGSYASASDPRIVVGLGKSAASPSVRVTWPGGTTEQWDGIAIDRYTTLREGTAK
jgi:hypothetical protein